MDIAEKRDFWRENLSTMKANLEKSYEFKTMVQEESQLIHGLTKSEQDYVIFSDYRRNEGKRRFEDIKDLIDTAMITLCCCDSKEASLVYFKTLKSVLRQSRCSNVLESFSKFNHTTD